jgi:drug/metabolite transporter (DMT)-like permease
VAQIVATALLLRVMEDRNFALGVAYAKTEVIQIGIFGLVFLGDPLTIAMIVAMVVATAGLLLLSPVGRNIETLVHGFTNGTALLGLASGAGFGIASIGYRGAALALPTDFPMAAATTLVAAQALQTLLLGGWLLIRKASIVINVLREWRRSLFAGAMGATASALWFTAFAIEPAANVRTLALIEIFFGYAVSRQIFREHFTRLEIVGMLLLLVGLVVVTLR